ncbi:MAG TPA: hypothetical protein VIL20_25670 [Sandaracinaceae bacterium]
MREHRMPEWHREDVLAMLRAPDDAWPPCCGGACDPCVLSLARVVRRARALLAARGPR